MKVILSLFPFTAIKINGNVTHRLSLLSCNLSTCVKMVVSDNYDSGSVFYASRSDRSVSPDTANQL